MWIVRLALRRPYTFVVCAMLVMILGIIQTLIAFDGTLSTWWTRIVVGALLLLFCLLQRLFEARSRKVA